MAPTTTAPTVFKATPNTQPTNHDNNSYENTSTLRKANVGAATSPGVIQPQTTVPSVAAEAENIRPPLPNISTEGTISPLNQDRDRDARAYERERQRTKHAGEWAKQRAKKATTQATFSGAGIGGLARARTAHAGRRAKALKAAKAELDVDIDVYAVTTQRKDMERTTARMCEGLDTGLFKRAPLPSHGGGGTDTSKAVQGVVVNLSDLVVSSQRKPRKLNDDFEVVPHIRSVIALDDVANIPDMDLDEAWEHVYADDEEVKAPDGFTGPSYARVVGAGCQYYGQVQAI